MILYHQRRDNSSWVLPFSNESVWHDEVDITQCFNDTAVLYSIAVIFLVFTFIKFLCGRGNKPAIPFSYLNVIKIVSCCVLTVLV